MKVGEQISTLTVSLEQAQKEVDALKKEKATATQKLDGRRTGKERAAYEQNGLGAKL